MDAPYLRYLDMISRVKAELNHFGSFTGGDEPGQMAAQLRSLVDGVSRQSVSTDDRAELLGREPTSASQPLAQVIDIGLNGRVREGSALQSKPGHPFNANDMDTFLNGLETHTGDTHTRVLAVRVPATYTRRSPSSGLWALFLVHLLGVEANIRPHDIFMLLQRFRSTVPRFYLPQYDDRPESISWHRIRPDLVMLTDRSCSSLAAAAHCPMRRQCKDAPFYRGMSGIVVP